MIEFGDEGGILPLTDGRKIPIKTCRVGERRLYLLDETQRHLWPQEVLEKIGTATPVVELNTCVFEGSRFTVWVHGEKFMIAARVANGEHVAQVS